MPEGSAETEAAKGISTREWENVPIAEINLLDSTLQFRLVVGLADIKASLKCDGQREPIDLMGKKPYRIVDGFRRVQAAMDLGWPTVKAFVHKNLTEDEAYKIAFLKNVRRKNLTPMEKAHAMHKAQKNGFKQTQLAEAFQITERQVRNYLQILSFPEPIQKIVDGVAVTMAHAKVLADYEAKDPASWRKRIVEEKLDARALKRELVKDGGARPAGRKRTFAKITKDKVRVYPFVISKDSPATERERALRALLDVVKSLKG